jgi:hypothetical protein
VLEAGARQVCSRFSQSIIGHMEASPPTLNSMMLSLRNTVVLTFIICVFRCQGGRQVLAGTFASLFICFHRVVRILDCVSPLLFSFPSAPSRTLPPASSHVSPGLNWHLTGPGILCSHLLLKHHTLLILTPNDSESNGPSEDTGRKFVFDTRAHKPDIYQSCGVHH